MSLKLGNTDIAGTQVLYSTTGSNTDGAMTQAATTTALGLKANDADVVHLTGNETIADTKTFTSPINVPQSDGWFDMLKMNSSNRPYIAGRSNTSITSLALCTVRNGYYYNIELHNNGNGTGYTVCPASDVNGSIVTTVNKSKAANGYFQFGNGLIINWGVTTAGGEQTITFAKAFTTTNIAITHTRATADGTNDNDAINTITKTNFKLRIYGGAGGRWIAVGY